MKYEASSLKNLCWTVDFRLTPVSRTSSTYRDEVSVTRPRAYNALATLEALCKILGPETIHNVNVALYGDDDDGKFVMAEFPVICGKLETALDFLRGRVAAERAQKAEDLRMEIRRGALALQEDEE
jgi:hypothetical protein